jgi:biopolymer transport protein ExbD
MSFGALSSDDEEIMSEINMTPLVDVMLVLLIVFMITVPVIQHSVKLDLPQARSHANDTKPPHVNVTIKADGGVRWNDIPMQPKQLAERISAAAGQHPQPELHLYAERQTPYEKVAQVMAAAQSGGLNKIGFVTDPNATPQPAALK